jgi:hypothetical protein
MIAPAVCKYTVRPFSRFRRGADQRARAHVDAEFCAICGKPITNEATAHPAIVIDGGSEWGDESSPEDAGHMGGFLVGPDCHKRFAVRS